MARIPPDLHADFPDLARYTDQMKTKDTHFARLMSDYMAAKRALSEAYSQPEHISLKDANELRETLEELRSILRDMLGG